MCDNPKCCNPAHLIKGTQKENMEDMRSKGRNYKKLTPEDIEEARNAPFGQLKVLAKRLGVSTSTVSRARRGVTHA